MSKFWSQRVKELDPYVPGEQPKDAQYIKLNTNENPYPPSDAVLAVFRQYPYESLSLYPDPNADELKQAVANNYGIQANQVFVGNGSDEVLAHVFVALLKHSQALLMPDISYSFYPVYSRLFGIERQAISLQDDFSINLDDYPVDNGGVIFPNPNAPTGMALSLDEIEAFLVKNTQSVVVVDEAYIDFGGDSAVALIDRYPNVLVIHTLSKSRSLAGLRVGYAMGDAKLIEALERVKNSFNSYPLGRVDIAAAAAAINDTDYLNETCSRIIKTREATTEALTQLGFKVLPSQANFIFAKPPAPLTAEQLYQSLKKHNVLIRYFSDERIADYARITIGTDESMQVMLEHIKQIMAA